MITMDISKYLHRSYAQLSVYLYFVDNARQIDGLYMFYNQSWHWASLMDAYVTSYPHNYAIFYSADDFF